MSRFTIAALALVPSNVLIWFGAMARRSSSDDTLVDLFALMTLVQLGCCIAAIVAGVRRRRSAQRGTADIVIGAVLGFFSFCCGLVGFGIIGLGGMMQGRPLRVRGKQLHPLLEEGADWTAGARPDASSLDLATRRALEALWLHDAQMEHASVPAFARLSWLLAAAGAPAELLVWCHRAATEEIEHAQACFALAAGYGGRAFTVQPMPEMLRGGLDGTIDPRVTLAIESLSDGCLLEGFNADVAAASARACTEPVTRALLHKIAREEHTHAELSWAILGWLVDRHRNVVERPLHEALRALDAYVRPTADEPPLADVAVLRQHGRLQDAEWQAAWDARLVATRARFADLLAIRRAA